MNRIAQLDIRTGIVLITCAWAMACGSSSTATGTGVSLTIRPAQTYAPPLVDPANAVLGTFGAVAISGPAGSWCWPHSSVMA